MRTLCPGILTNVLPNKRGNSRPNVARDMPSAQGSALVQERAGFGGVLMHISQEPRGGVSAV